MATQTTGQRSRERAERRLLGQLSRRELARRCGLHYSYVSRVLSGKRSPRIEVAARMAAALKLSLDDFRTRLRTLAGETGGTA